MDMSAAFVSPLGPARGLPAHPSSLELQEVWPPTSFPSREPRWVLQSGATCVTVAAAAAAASVFVRQRFWRKHRKAPSCRVVRLAEDTGADAQSFSAAFPFSAVVGQEQIKLALLLNLVDPGIGGVMISGERGTGKSTAVRGMVRLLPDITVVAGDKYNSHPSDVSLQSDEVQAKVTAGEKLELVDRRTPFVELPLGATEDRVTGTIDIERALKEAGKAFEPGILARVNRGILYIDECNLLDDQLVDVLLDSAAGGINTVEREGVSVRHPARFILIGTSHPDEGDLRPQLLDRFGLTCSIRTANDAGWRIEVLKRSYEWSKNKDKVEDKYAKKDAALKALILEARDRLPRVVMPRELAVKVSTICSKLNIDGLRGDIVTNRTAKALAALEGRAEVTEEDVRRVAVLCLQHRLRKDVVSDSGINNSGRVVQALMKQFGEGPPPMRPVAELVEKPVSA